MSARRLRVAWFSPLPPRRSGIADYSAELLPALAHRWDLEVFTPGGEEMDSVFAGDGVAVHDERAFSRRAATAAYDAVVYQLGNNAAYHSLAYTTLQRHPGVVVLHEFMLHHLVQDLTLSRGDEAGYVEAMRYCCGATGEAAARRLLDTGVPFDRWRFPLFEQAVDRSRAVLVHNEFCRRRVLASRPRARVGRVPLPWVPRVGAPAVPGEGKRLRAELGIPAEAFVVGSFGFITPEKRLEPSLRAFLRLRRERPEAIFLLVGEVSPHYDLEPLLGGGLGEGVVRTGRVPLDEFHRFIAAADVAVNLRHPTGGETSASLVRLLGLGMPVLVSDHGSFAELPDGSCAKVPMDGTEEEVVLAYLRALAGDPALRRAIGAAARRHAGREHDLAATVAGYAAFFEEVVAECPVPAPPAPPLAPYPREDVLTSLAAAVARDAADLGIGEDDDEGLEALASALAELLGHSSHPHPRPEGGREAPHPDSRGDGT